VTWLAVLAALPAAAAVIYGLLHSPIARRIVAAPRGDRWHASETPSFGGIGIAFGCAAGVGAALVSGYVQPSGQLLGILAGAGLLFVAGLVDDLRSLNPIAKLAVQFGAAAIVLSTGLTVQIVSNDVLAVAIGAVWLVGMTNAFNLLDNMDGLAATMAAIAALYFAIDAVTAHPDHLNLILAAALGLACLGFLPFNLRPGRAAAVFMGDSGSQVLGFLLASLGLASSWKVAGTTVATLLLPILVLAVPILDTTLVTIVRLLEGRPIHQGGRDHTSHRLVSRGLSEKKAVVLLAVIAAGLGGTSLAYNVLDDVRYTLVGVLLTFALLVQFASFLADVDLHTEGPFLMRAFVLHRRRLVEVIIDFALITAAFAAAYYLRIQGTGTIYERHIFQVSLPAVLAARYLAFIPFGLYRGVWRYAGARDAVSVVAAVVLSEAVAFGFLAATQIWGDFPKSVFVIDALICAPLIGGARFAERALLRMLASLKDRGDRQRTLIVGAGRGGRSLLRELRETSGEHVVGFLDDDPQLRRRRLQGVSVLGGTHDVARVLEATKPDVVLVTIPDARRDRLDDIVRECTLAAVPCRFVRRQTDLDPRVVLGASTE
jgi:UDP-GlcNAc:undecaprenyl-phosphate GlcNAc-1-phosphate transferase